MINRLLRIDKHLIYYFVKNTNWWQRYVLAHCYWAEICWDMINTFLRMTIQRSSVCAINYWIHIWLLSLSQHWPWLKTLTLMKNIDHDEKHSPCWKTFIMTKKTFTTLKNTHQDVGQNLPGKTLGQHQGQGWISRCDHAAEPCLEGIVIVIDIIGGSSLPMSLPSKSRFWSLQTYHAMPL